MHSPPCGGAPCRRYATSKSGEKEISLEDYVSNMKDDQKNIYYISGEDKESLLKSPSVEKLLSKDIEIIFMTDSVDEYTVQHLTEYEGKRLINASREGLKLEEGDVEKKRDEQYKARPLHPPSALPPPSRPCPPLPLQRLWLSLRLAPRRS